MRSMEAAALTLHGPVSASVLANGDITYSHGYTSRKEGAPAASGAKREATKAKGGGATKLGVTPSHGNPASTSALNTELNNVARNTDDTAKARALVDAGADLTSTMARTGGTRRCTR